MNTFDARWPGSLLQWMRRGSKRGRRAAGAGGRERGNARLSLEPLEARQLLNAAPLATDDVFAVQHDHVLSVAAPGVLANDLDADGDALAAVPLDQPQHGSLTLAGDGSFVYTPETGFRGTDRFTYDTNDGAANSPVPGTVWLRVEPPQLVKDINTLPAGANIQSIVDVGGVAFFVADDGLYGSELWRADDTGTSLVEEGAAAVAATRTP